MKTMKTLSIIIPVYNTGQYLRQCLDSVIIDNSFNGEIVCVNDGSTDDSQEILMQYAEQYHNIVVLTQKNGGLSNARNSGLSAAKGEYVMFVDSDDMLAPGAVDAIMASVTNEDIFYVDVKIFNEDSGFYEPEEHRTPVRQVPGRDYYATYPVSDPPLYCVCVWGGGIAEPSFCNISCGNKQESTMKTSCSHRKRCSLRKASPPYRSQLTYTGAGEEASHPT